MYSGPGERLDGIQGPDYVDMCSKVGTLNFIQKTMGRQREL